MANSRAKKFFALFNIFSLQFSAGLCNIMIIFTNYEPVHMLVAHIFR